MIDCCDYQPLRSDCGMEQEEALSNII
jgi:hypothetical protein